MDSVLVKLYVPMMEKRYEVKLPINKRIGNDTNAPSSSKLISLDEITK